MAGEAEIQGFLLEAEETQNKDRDYDDDDDDEGTSAYFKKTEEKESLVPDLAFAARGGVHLDTSVT